MATESTRLTEYENGYEVRGPYASNTPTGMFEGQLPSDLREYLNAQGDLSLLGRRFFRSRITEDMPYEQSMGILQKFRSLNQDPESMVRGLLFQSEPEDVSDLSQEERQERAFEGLRKSKELRERKDIFEQFLDKQGFQDGGTVYNKPLISSAAQATNIDPLLRMYNRSPASQGGLESLINPPRTDPGGAADRQAMMDMQKSTFLPHLAGLPNDGSTTGDDDDAVDNVSPTEDIPFVDAVVNPDVEGGYEAPVSTTGTSGGQNIPYVPGQTYTQQMQNLYGPYYGAEDFAGRPNDNYSGAGINFGGLGSGIGAAGRWLAGAAGDAGKLLVEGAKYTPQGALVNAILTDRGVLDSDRTSGSTLDPEIEAMLEAGQQMDPQPPEDYGVPRDNVNELVDDALAVDVDDLLQSIDDTQLIGGTSAERNAYYERERQNNIIRGLNEKQETEDAFSNRMNALFEPGSGYGNATPMLSSNRNEQFATGRIGIGGRMLPKAGSGFGGNNPFQSEAPAPGTPGYADYIIDSMGFDPQNVQNEISEIVRKDMPFHTAYDQEGNTILIDKITGDQQVIPATPGNQNIQQGQKFVGRVGGGMNLGGLVSSLMPLKY